MIPLNYDFLSPPRITFGWGRRGEAGAVAATLGRRAFVVSGSRSLERAGRIAEIEDALAAANVETVRLTSQSREPEVEDVDRAVRQLGEQELRPGDFVLAIGGGSAIDLAKAVAALATNAQGASVVEFLEGVGTGRQLERPPLPLMAMPTTAGTGTEATKNAVISSYAPAFKKSLRSDRMVPRVVLVDPELSVTVPPETTAHTGMDAVTQLIESYISRRAKPIPQALCLQGLELAIPALPQAVRDGTSRPAREAMAHAALLSGLALANSGLGFAHGVAASLGVHARVPHGLACAVMLPVAMRLNREVSRDAFARLAPIVTGRTWSSTEAAVEGTIARIEELAAEIDIPRRLSDLGVTVQQIPAIAAGSRGNSMSGNPRDVGDEELRELLEGML